METVFFRLLEAENKGISLQEAIAALPKKNTPEIFAVNPHSFEEVPHSPFAYWVRKKLLNVFKNFESLEKYHTACLGLQTQNDFRFLRLSSEINVCRKEHIFFPFIKGGAFSKFYFDTYLFLKWAADGQELKAFALLTPGTQHWSRNIRSPHLYFRPGITWPRRTNRLSIRVMPKNSIFGEKGPAIFIKDNNLDSIMALCAIMNSQVFKLLLELKVGTAELAQTFEVGLIQKIPVPSLATSTPLSTLSYCAWSLKRNLDTITQTSHAFILPALLQVQGNTLSQRAQAWAERVAATEQELSAIQDKIDALAFELYGISPEDIGSGQQFAEAEANADDDEEEDEAVEGADLPHLVQGLIEYGVGVAFGRFDLRLATGEREYPPEPEPFDPLPACSPGMLVTEKGLPPDDVSELPAAYPIEIPFSGILVDDVGHSQDLVVHLQRVLEQIWGNEATDIEQEAIESLNSGSLRAYLAKGTAFFAQHIKRYSKSRRKAPIYWQLSIPSTQYSVWLYYHRFTKDTFYTVLNDYVKPKLDHEDRKLTNLRQEAGPDASASQRKEIAAQEAFVAELQAFRDEVAIIAPLWNPNLNDGVIINFAPLWRLVPHHRSWQKDCKACWDKLIKGEFDWAHLAMHLWPERVVPKCANDRSLAIAHDLEEVFWQEDPKTNKWHSRTVSKEQVAELIQTRTSPAVKDALKKLLEAPAPGGSTKARSRRKRS